MAGVFSRNLILLTAVGFLIAPTAGWSQTTEEAAPSNPAVEGSAGETSPTGLGNSGAALGGDEDTEGEAPATTEDAQPSAAPAESGETADADADTEVEAAAAPTSGASGLIPEVKAPESAQPLAKGNGGIGYEYAVDMPDYRGLEPKLRLIYNSMRKSKTGGLYQPWTGYGWGMAGFDVIERMRLRQGVASFSAADVYLLNGVELLPCPPGSASPSCTSGGTHVAENENYRRIKFVSATNIWEITDSDGTKTTLRSVGELGNAGTLTPGTPDHDMAYRYRWLSKQIVDTHVNASGAPRRWCTEAIAALIGLCRPFS